MVLSQLGALTDCGEKELAQQANNKIVPHYGKVECGMMPGGKAGLLYR
jgi:hypothetical protein